MAVDRQVVPVEMVTRDGKVIDIALSTWERLPDSVDPRGRWISLENTVFENGYVGYVHFVYEFPFGCRQSDDMWANGAGITLTPGEGGSDKLHLSGCVTPRRIEEPVTQAQGKVRV